MYIMTFNFLVMSLTFHKRSCIRFATECALFCFVSCVKGAVHTEKVTLQIKAHSYIHQYKGSMRQSYSWLAAH